MIALSDLELVDFHIHTFSRTTVSQRVRARSRDYIEYLGISNEDSRSKWIDSRFQEDITSPYYRSLLHYIANTYGCNPTIEAVDKFLEKKYEEDFGRHIE